MFGKRNVGIRRTLLSATAVMLVTGLTAPVAAPLPETLEQNSYAVVNQHIRDTLRELAARMKIPANISRDITGRVKRSQEAGGIEEYLDALGRDHEFNWYYDGTMIHFTPANKFNSKVLVLGEIEAQRFRKRLEELQILDERFKFHPDSNGNTLMIAGPPPYIELVEATLEAEYQRLKEESTPEKTVVKRQRSGEVRVFRAENVETLRFTTLESGD